MIIEPIINYWAQITVVLGAIGYILRSFFDFRLKSKELRFKYYYELKAQKIIEIYSNIVQIQISIDRRKEGVNLSFENNIREHRIKLDKYYWESSFYLSSKSEKEFKRFLQWLKYFESKEMIEEDPTIEINFKQICHQLISEFKNDIV